MGDPWGIGGFRGGDKPNIEQIVKKKIGKHNKTENKLYSGKQIQIIDEKPFKI